MTLIAIQQQSGGADSAASSSSQSNSPLNQLFSAMDTNSDGSVSESEMESYIENLGGTQGQADAVYNALSQNGASSAATNSTGVNESQMQNALSQASPSHGMHHHHHHHAGSGGSADQVSNSLLQAMDTDDDGTVSQSEFTNFITANGGTAADAQTDFAALDTSGSGSLTSADFAKAWQNWQAQQTSQSSGSAMVSLLDNFAKANSAAASMATTSLSA